jgi:MFS transporter, YNFM family, putative membrane transport protein
MTTAPDDPAGPRADGSDIPYRAIFWLSTASFAAAANFRVVDTMLPAIGDGFGVSAAQASVVVAAYAVTFGVLQLLYGQLGDRYGRLWVVTIAAGLAGFAGIACAFSTSLTMLTVLRAISGGMAAGIVPTALAFIGDTVHFDKRQAMLARFALGTTLGQVFGQSVGGVLTAHLGWRYTFGCLAGLFTVAACALFLEARKRKRVRPTGRLRLVAGTVSTLSLLKRRNIRMVLALLFFEAAFGMGTFTFVATHLRESFGLGYEHIGALITLNALGALCYFSCAPFLLRRIGQLGIVLTGGALLGLSYAGAVVSDTWYPFIGVIFANGVGLYMLHNTMQTYATQMAPDMRGPGMSLFAATLFLSQTVGVLLTGFLYAHYGAVPAFTLAAVILPVLGIVMRMRIKANALRAAA